MKKALCVGINNYPGTSNDLQGCVNDANDWSELLTGLGFETSQLLDSQATRQNVKIGLAGLVASTRENDVIIFTYSGHGTQVIDLNSDEGDTYDEAIYVYDGTVLDDDLRVIIDQVHPKASLVVISDSCFSGTVTRLVPEHTKPRFMPNQDVPPGRVVRQHFLLPEANIPELLVSGCSDSEYSYDAEIDGRYNGAMTAMALKVIRQDPQATYAAFYAGLRARLPSQDYPQTPQLEGSTAHKGTRLFEPFPASDPGPTPEPEPNPNPGCLKGFFQAMAGWFK